MKFECSMKVRSVVEIVELVTVKQLQVAMLEASGFQQSEVDHVLQSQGVKDGWKWQSKKRPAWQPKNLFWQSKKRPLETKFLMLANSLRINFSFCCSFELA